MIDPDENQNPTVFFATSGQTLPSQPFVAALALYDVLRINAARDSGTGAPRDFVRGRPLAVLFLLGRREALLKVLLSVIIASFSASACQYGAPISCPCASGDIVGLHRCLCDLGCLKMLRSTAVAACCFGTEPLVPVAGEVF